jgi:hypothetical protein
MADSVRSHSRGGKAGANPRDHDETILATR